MRFIVIMFAVFSISACPRFAVAATDFEEDFQKSTKTLNGLIPEYGERMEAGDMTGATSKLLAAFPENTRTPADSFLLGNVFFETDWKQSYALHQAAAKALPDNDNVQWEWALEQHRAGEYAGALATYEAYSKVKPRSAVPYALQADCHLRLNRVDSAIATWRKSEAAPNGSLETMEEMVCAVHREPAPYRRRADLLAKVIQKHDLDAAAELIALDCDFPNDWWNGGPQKQFLAHDLKAIGALNLPVDNLARRSLECAAQCSLIDEEKPEEVKAILLKHRLILDADQTLPAHSALLSAILQRALISKAIDAATVRKQLAPKLQEAAKKGKDATLWNVALFAADEADGATTLSLERQAWQATGDARFAVATLYFKSLNGGLKANDPELFAALKQFPESGPIHRAAVDVAVREKNLTRELLVSAARAEFTHFSSFTAPATVINRPRSNYLRQYFALLLKMPATTQPAS